MMGYKRLVFLSVLLGGVCWANEKIWAIHQPSASQKPVQKPLTADTSIRHIYLSFDDGPQHGTLECFELCQKLGVKATFFMVGQHQAQKPDGKILVSLIRKSYPQSLLANHSYTHASNRYRYFYRHPQMAARDFFRAQDSLQVGVNIARLPGNRAWVTHAGIRASGLVRPVAMLLDSAGYNVIGWDVEWSFGRKSERPVQSPAQMLQLIDSAFARKDTHTTHHLVILTHDRMFRKSTDLDALARFIALLKQRPKYVFETLDHYPNLKKPLQPVKSHG